MTQARQDGITLKQWLPLIGLTCCAFVFNTSEFMPIGLLTDIAASFSLTESQAGIMISVYAWGVMLLSLPLMVFASRFEFKRMLLGVLAVFSLGQFLSAVAPTYPILVCARLVVACAHAVFWSVASIMASRLVDTRHGALAISMIATGSSIAQIFGLPLGRAIGLAVGWRMTFAVVGVLSAIAVVYQATVFPAMPAGERFTVKQLPELLKNPLLIALYAVTVFMATGYYAGYSYIEPFLAQVAHVDAGAITMTLTAFGCSGLLGSWLFGRLFDGHRFPFLAITLSGVPAALLLMAPAASALVLVLAVCALWGCCATAFNVAFQAELIKYTPADSSAVAMSIFSGLFNLGIGTGTAIGGAVVSVPVSLGSASRAGRLRRGRHPRHHGDVPSHTPRQARRLATSSSSVAVKYGLLGPINPANSPYSTATYLGEGMHGRHTMDGVVLSLPGGCYVGIRDDVLSDLSAGLLRGSARNAAPVAEDELAQAANAAPNPDAPIMKIAQWADYLQELGIGAVLINPPLESDSHGYDTRSLRHIDRRLGGDADFAAVCETLHAHGIRVVLDAVFNHVGRGFWAFRDVQERRWDSPYKDWFHISFDGDSCYGDGFWYEAGRAILSL